MRTVTVSYTHLDVYKRQGLCYHICTFFSTVFCLFSFCTEGWHACDTHTYMPVSYTHLDVYKRQIEKELDERVKYFKGEDKLIEAQRIAERTNFDIEMMRETGFCSGIENLSLIHI